MTDTTPRRRRDVMWASGIAAAATAAVGWVIAAAILLKPHDELCPIPEAARQQSGDYHRRFAQPLKTLPAIQRMARRRSTGLAGGRASPRLWSHNAP
jgi:hypothetical protein